MSQVLERSRPRISLLDFSRHEIETFLRRKLAEHPTHEAYLFGSYIQNQATAWSDIDLIIVMPSEIPFPERARSFHSLFELGVPFDILVYTPDEFEQLRDSDSGFWANFRKHHHQVI